MRGFKTLTQTFLYIVAVAGAFLMLIPFAWMVDTSFKAPSEVSSWPPSWTTKNANNSNPFQTKIQYRTSGSGVDLSSLSLSEFKNYASLIGEDTGKDTLVLTLDDDLIRRGTIELQLLNPDGKPADYPSADYNGTFANLMTVYSSLRETLPPNYAESINNLPDVPSDFIEGVLDASTYKDDGFAKRIIVSTELVKLFSDASGKVETVVSAPFKVLPIDNEETKTLKAALAEKAISIATPLNERLAGSSEKYIEYRTGEGRTVTGSELNEILEALNHISVEAVNTLVELQTALNESIPATDTRLRMSLKQLDNSFKNNIIKPFEQWKNLLTIYGNAMEYYALAQVNSLSSPSIVAKIRTDGEAYEKLMEGTAILDIPQDLKEHIMASIKKGNVRNSLNIFLKYIDNRFLELVDGSIEDPRNAFEKINDGINLIKTSLMLAEDKDLQNRLDQFAANPSDYSTLRALMEELGKKSGQTVLMNVSLGNFDRLEELFGSEKLVSLVLERLNETKWIGEFSKLQSDVLSELDIIEKPEEIEKVYFRGRTTTSGKKTFEIKFNGIPAIWFKDDVPAGKVNYSSWEVFKNFWQNYADAWNAAPFGRYYINTILVAVVTTFLEIIFAAMAAFAFAKMDFFGKNFMFTLFLATMMVPGEVLLIPNFITLTVFGWIDTYYALIVPWVVSVFAIFLLRQHFMTIPDELYDAAKMDGLSKWRYLWRIMVPLSKPAIITGALLKFVGSWNSFLWVLIVTKSPEYRTLTVGLQNFSSATGTDYNLLMSAATFSIVPVVILFLMTQKYFIAGIARSGLK